MRTIKPIILTKEDFASYGDVLSIEDANHIIINKGYAKKHFNLSDMDCNEAGGVATLHLYVGKKREFPLKINMMEKHPFFSQTFMPRSFEPFLVVVALGKEKPDLNTLKVFKTNGNQGVQYKKGVWHFPLICLKDNEQFIVIDRNDRGIDLNKVVDCVEVYINEDIEVLKD